MRGRLTGSGGLVGASQPLGTAQERFEQCEQELRNHTKVLMA